MYKKPKMLRTTINVNQSVEGESIETKVERIINNNEPITDGAPIIYMERKDGVQAGYDIRTDRFEVAVEGMDKVTKSQLAKREEGITKRAEKAKNSGAESTGGNSEQAN